MRFDKRETFDKTRLPTEFRLDCLKQIAPKKRKLNSFTALEILHFEQVFCEFVITKIIYHKNKKGCFATAFSKRIHPARFELATF